MAFMSLQVSREGESVALGPNLKARGAVEDWLTAMEENMRKVLHRFIKVALVELEGINFDGGDATRETLHIIPLDWRVAVSCTQNTASWTLNETYELGYFYHDTVARTADDEPRAIEHQDNTTMRDWSHSANAGLGRVRTKRPSRNVQNTAEARVAWALEGQPAQGVATAIQICWAR